MFKKDLQNSIIIGVVLWLVHVFPYLMGSLLNHDFEQSFFMYNGALGIAQDLISYGFQINHGAINPTFFHVDASTVNDIQIPFADGNLTTLYCAFLLHILGSLNAVLLFAPLPILIVSVHLINKIVKLLTGGTNWLLVVVVTLLVFLTGIDDFLGLNKIYSLLSDGAYFKMGTNNIVMGYMQRFPNGQISYVAFLWWFYLLVKFLITKEKSLFVWVPIALALLHYVYFYYWTYAVAFTALVLLSSFKENKKEAILSMLLYVLLSFPFWWVAYEFVTHAIYPDYSKKVAVNAFYNPWVIHLLGLGSLLLLKRSKSFLILMVPFLLQVIIAVVSYVFQPFYLVYVVTQWIVPVVIFGFLLKSLKQFVVASLPFKLLLMNYLVMFVLLNLNFIIHFNIQPFHWVYVGFYPILVIAVVVGWHEKNADLLGLRIVQVFSFSIVAIALINGGVYAKSEHKFWRLQTEEEQVIQQLRSEKEKGMIAGNNLSAISSMAVNTGCKIYFGQGHLCDFTRREATQRFINNFRLLGYSNENINSEYNAYQHTAAYKKAYKNNPDSLSVTWPNNITLVTESILHYWHDPVNYKNEFDVILSGSVQESEMLLPQYILIYKLTAKRTSINSRYQLMLENEKYLLYKL